MPDPVAHLDAFQNEISEADISANELADMNHAINQLRDIWLVASIGFVPRRSVSESEGGYLPTRRRLLRTSAVA